jgi:manganese oxidase
VKEGETVKIRLINVWTSAHAIHIHGHHFLVTHKDGYPLPAPYHADTVPILPGERYDVLLTANNPGNWMLHDHIGGHAANNNIDPGGIMTHVLYEGFSGGGGGHEHGSAKHRSAGSLLGMYRR